MRALHPSPWGSSPCAASHRAWHANSRPKGFTSLISLSTARSAFRKARQAPRTTTRVSIPMLLPRPTSTCCSSLGARGPGKSSCGPGWKHSEGLKLGERVMPDAKIQAVLKRFETPDEARQFEKGKFEIVHLGGQ